MGSSVAGSIRRLWNDAGPDRGWSWVILGATWVFSVGTYGVFSSGGAGVIFVELLLVYGVSRKDAMWPFSIMGIAQCVSGLMSGFVFHYIDIRKMFLCASFLTTAGVVLCFWANGMLWISLCFGVIYGTGMGISINYCPYLLSTYFKKYQATANGIFLSSIPAAGFFLSPFMDYLIGVYGLRGSLLILGGVIMQLVVASALLRPRNSKHFHCLEKSQKLLEVENTLSNTNGDLPPKEMHEEQCGKLKKTLKMYIDVLSEPMLYIITAQAAVGMNVLVGVAITLVDFLMDIGYQRKMAINVLTVLAAAGLVGRVGSGVIADRRVVTLRTLSMWSMLFIAVGLFLMKLSSSVVLMIVAVVIVGVSEGVCHNVINLNYKYYIGQEKLPGSFSIRLFIIGLSAFVRPLIVGYCRDTLGTYVYFYYYLGAVSALSGISWLLEPWCVHWKNGKDEPNEYKQSEELKT